MLTATEADLGYVARTLDGMIRPHLMQEISARALPPQQAARAFSRPLFVRGAELDAFFADFRAVLGVVGRLPALLQLGLPEFAAAAGAGDLAARLLAGRPVPGLVPYGRADLHHDGEGFKILELGLSPAVGGVARAALVTALLAGDPEIRSLGGPRTFRPLDPVAGALDLLQGVSGEVILTEATGGLGEWQASWQSFADALSARGLTPRFAEIGDLAPPGRAPVWRLFRLEDLLTEPDPARSWATVTACARAAPVITDPACDVFNSKACLALLRHPEVTVAISPAERAAIDRTVPATFLPDAAASCLDRETTILKPAMGARGEGTIAGWETSEPAWAAAVASARRGGYVAQSRIQSRAELAADPGTGELVAWRAVWGMHYGPGGVTGMSARVVRASGQAVVDVGSDAVKLAPVLVHDDQGAGTGR